MDTYSGRGTVSKSSTLSTLDDYGRLVRFLSRKVQVVSSKIVRTVPKGETHQDMKNAVQKFRVKLLPEGGSQGTINIFCQIGLDS